MLTRRSRIASLALLATVAVFAGCGAGDDDAAGDAAETSEQSAEEAEADDGSAGDETEEAAAPAVGQAPAQDADAPVGERTERLLRREADLVVEVTDLEGTTEMAVTAADEADGYLATQHITPEQSSMTLRVPSEDFDAVLDEVAALGTLRSQQITTDDRTEVIIDLEARLETAEASLDRTRTFFDEAADVDDLTLLESQLADREAEVASLQAQLDNERSSVALSTIRLTLTLDPGVDPAEVVPDDDPLPGVADALGSGWNAIRTAGYVVVLVAAFLLPWLIPLVLLALAIRWLVRRNRARRAGGDRLPPPPLPGVVTPPPPSPSPTPTPPTTATPPGPRARPEPPNQRLASRPAPPAGVAVVEGTRDPDDEPAGDDAATTEATGDTTAHDPDEPQADKTDDHPHDDNTDDPPRDRRDGPTGDGPTRS